MVEIVSGTSVMTTPREQQHAVGLNGRNRRWSVCKPDGGDEPTKADVAQRLFRSRREASDWSYRYWKDGKQRWLGLGSQKDVSLKDARLARDAARLRVKGDRGTPGVDIVQEK